ncbi:hypothetical protein, partial [Pseudomonas sp. Bc-h]|uniref:hypothetical protein n=1 Tax=Pseudomonas sp. Bc-h TaxID=1943632 RepID=UPI001C475C13
MFYVHCFVDVRSGRGRHDAKESMVGQYIAQSYCFAVILTNLKLTVDAPLDLSIIRPTSGADETENSLRIKELDEVSSEEVL